MYEQITVINIHNKQLFLKLKQPYWSYKGKGSASLVLSDYCQVTHSNYSTCIPLEQARSHQRMKEHTLYKQCEAHPLFPVLLSLDFTFA